MKLSTNNFFSHIKNLITGGGVNTALEPAHDAGFLKDVTIPLAALSASESAVRGVTTLAFPIQLASMTTAAADLVTNYTPGYAFKILAVDFVTTTLGTGAAASQTINLEIGTTNVTGGVVNPTLASTDTLGELTAGTAVTALNTGTASSTLSIEVAAGGTVFTAGAGTLLVRIQNTEVGLTASETNLLVQSFAASTTTAGTFSFVVPRDYDEATDTLQVKIGAAMAGATDTTTGLSITAYRKRPGANIVTVATDVTGKLTGVTTAADLTATEQVLYFNLSRNSLQRDDAITIVVTAQAHTTDALLVYFVEPTYRSTLVSYDKTDGANDQTGSSLR